MKQFKTFLFCILFTTICNITFSQTQSVCSVDDLPAGWVVTNINKNCTGCCGADASQPGISYTITKIDAMPIGSIVFVCINDNLPYGWIVIDTNTKCVACCGTRGSEKGTSYQIKRIS